MTAYEKSNNIESVEFSVSAAAKKAYKDLLNSGDASAKERQVLSNKLVLELCRCFKIRNVSEVRVCNVAQDSKTVNGRCVRKTMGKYMVSQNMIIVFNKTAIRKNTVAIKSFTDTLLHEFCHALDYLHYKLGDSLHTAGFYKRITSLKIKLG